MNPQQQPFQPQTPAPNQSNQYDFIMNAGQQPQKSKFGMPSGGSTLQRIFTVVAGAVILIIVAMVFMSLIGGGSDRTASLLDLAQDQTEIIRVADLAKSERSVRQTTTQNFAANTSISLTTSKLEVMEILKSQKIKQAQLSLKKSTKTDTLLASAAANNQYDEVFMTTLTSKLEAYQTKVKTLFGSAKSTKEQQVLKNAFESVTILLGKPVTAN